MSPDLSDAEVQALKQLEKRNRDVGAAGMRTEDWMAERGPFQLRAEARSFLKYLDPQPGDCVLDAGAGLGRLAMEVAPRVARLLCTDLSGGALRVLEEGARARGIGNIETLESDLCVLPASLGPFDRAYSIEVLQHIPSARERLQALRSVRAVLKPGGRFLVCVFGWNWRVRRAGWRKEGFWGEGDRRLYACYHTPAELRAVMQQAGFRNVKVRGLIVLPGRITKRLPPRLACLETWAAALPPTTRLAWFLTATGQR